MKKYLFLLTLSLFLLAPGLAKAEKIDNLETSIKINTDATIRVTEKIQYNFESEARHGIFRIIPIKYNDPARGGKYNLRISDITVTDENNQPYNYEISYPGNNIEIKIGEADILVTGSKTYIISYSIRRAVNYFADHDEIYWNVTGNEWPVEITKSSATVTLPQILNQDKIQKKCFSGPYGATDACTSDKFVATLNNQGQNIEFKQDALAAYEGLTIVVGWPVGLVHKPTFQESLKDFIIDNKGTLLVFVFLILSYIVWYLWGRDPKGREVIVAEYEAPDNLSPAEVGTIIDERTDKKDISAEIINLAVKGYLKIKRVVPDGIIKKPIYTLIKLKPSDTLTAAHQKDLFNAIFTTSREEVELSDLQDDFYKKYQKITQDIYQSATTDGYFPKDPQKIRKRFRMWGLILTIVTYFLTDTLSSYLGIFSCVLACVIVWLFSRQMSHKTVKGVLAKEKILGLKEYLTVAEKDRLKFHNAPEKNPQLFEKLLPFAMVMGVENAWAGQFADIYKQPPSWYDSDEDLTHFNSALLASNLSNFSSQASSVLNTPPASASSGSSGFSSGGGSGGGFGGGGGGSW